MEYKISIIKIIHDTIVDGEGFRTSIYSAGCPHHCIGCHNQESWDMKNGTIMSVEDIYNEIISNSLTNITFTGGDPMYQADSFYQLAKLIKKTTEKSIWCYTGFRYEELQTEYQQKLLNLVDVLVDGKFNQNLADSNLRFKGSSNQRIIDINKTKEKGEVVLYQPYC